jgi:hypothetical protein
VQRLEDAGPFGLVSGKLTADAAAGSVYHVCIEQAIINPVLDFTRGEAGGCAESGSGHAIASYTRITLQDGPSVRLQVRWLDE